MRVKESIGVFMVLSLSTNLPGGDWPENLTPQPLPVADFRLSLPRSESCLECCSVVFMFLFFEVLKYNKIKLKEWLAN